MTKVWISPVNNCDLCDAPFGENEPMYDANILGQWGNVCGSCFTRFGCKLGTGRGQRYELQRQAHSDNKIWVKVAG